MVEVDASLELIGPDGPLTLLDAFEGRRQLIAYYFMWYPGHPAPDQCEGCTFFTSHVAELSGLHSRGITYAVFCQGRNVAFAGAEPQASYEASLRYRDFMRWDVPWYSAQPSLDELLVGRQAGLFHLVCYLRDGDRVFETYWTTGRGVETMGYSVRAPGAMGRLASRLAAAGRHADQQRRTRLAGRTRRRRPSHRPVAPACGRAFGRPDRAVKPRESASEDGPSGCHDGD
jgi:hypothetical protein